jgi:hypothetical protein
MCRVHVIFMSGKSQVDAEMPDFDPNLTPFGLGFTVLRSQAVILCGNYAVTVIT